MDEQDYWRERFCRIMALNEALFGQSRDRLEGLIGQTGIRMGINLDRPMSLCLTGLEKRFYMSRLGMSREDFIVLTRRLDRHLGELFTALGCPMEGEVVQYDQSKQLCYIFPADGLPLSSGEIAEELQRAVIEGYRDCPGFPEGGLSNVTALVERVETYEDLAPAFETARQLNRMGFFLVESQVMTEEKRLELCRPCTPAELMALMDAVEQAVDRGNLAEMEGALSTLILDRLRMSFDFGLVKDTLAELRKKLLRYAATFGLALEGAVDSLFVKQYANVEELYRAALGPLRACCEATAAHGHVIGPLTREAIYYMRGNFRREIGLEDVAEHIGVSGGYLSRVFNREMGESLPAHLTRIRMNRAAALLENGPLKVGEIGAQVGIANPQYFGSLFKKQMGVTPQEYRRDYHAQQGGEGE